MDYLYHYSSPLGPVTIASDSDAIIGIWFDGQKYFGRILSEEVYDCRGSSKVPPVLVQAAEWLERYFAGKIPGEIPPLRMRGTSFQKSVWEILLTIPCGQTMTYGEIAKRLAAKNGMKSMSAQAVGGAVGHNPISIMIPCHRVVGAGGKLTGYAGGLERKEWLLALERSAYECGTDADRYINDHTGR